MSVIEGVLKEEIERLEANVLAYQSILEKLPRGSIFIRKMHNKSFVYRKRKENGKVVSEYIGQLDSDKAKEEIKKSEEYKRIKSNLSIAIKELNRLRKAAKAF